MKPLGREFFERNTRVVALELIGKYLVFERHPITLTGRIVETEAYFGASDPASHAYRGLTDRNRPMFGLAGKSYVYFTYGNHHCLNVVTEKENVAGAVLIRALEPGKGLAVMRKRRAKAGRKEDLTNGPGKLTQAFGITREHSEWDLTQPPLFIADDGEREALHIQAATRIGISNAKDLLLRFYLKQNSCVSKK